MELKRFKTDKKKETEGTWVNAGEGLQLLVARLTNKQYQEHVRRLGKPHARQIRANNLSIDIINEITRKAVAKHVLLGWKNLQDDDGSNIEYTQQKALELLEQYADFYDMVLEFAQDVENFQTGEEEDAEKN